MVRSFYISVDMGDLVYSLLFCKILNVDTIYVDGASNDVKFDWDSANFLLPLINSQDYIKAAELYDGQDFDVNYGLHPTEEPVIVGTNLTAYHASKFNINQDDSRLYEPWLRVGEHQNPMLAHKKVLINRTSRYHGDYSFYSNFLRYVDPEFLVFAGLESEYSDFYQQFGISMDFVKATDGLRLAEIINVVPTFVGNESLICAIAKGLGKHCYVEHGRMAANYIFNRKNIFYF